MHEVEEEEEDVYLSLNLRPSIGVENMVSSSGKFPSFLKT
jgi:hypothetical protein